MNIYDKEGRLLLNTEVSDDSHRYRSIKGENSLYVKLELADHVEIPVGAYCDYQGQRYTLLYPESIKKIHTRHFEYSLTFEAMQAKAKLWKFRNPVDGRLKFSLTAKPHEHLQMYVDNMNSRDAGWEIGECLDSTEKVINYNHDYCHDALARMATEFGTEFEIVGKSVSLKKVEYHKNMPLRLSYGKGYGFKSGVGRYNSEDKPPTEILYVQGGERNIDRSKYGSPTLLLPAGVGLSFDGVKFEREDGFNEAVARRYVTDAQGLSIRRADKQLSSMAEDSLDATHIYPSRVGVVSESIEVNAGKHFYDFTDTTIPEALDYEKHLIAGEKMTIIFQSGMLAGREFEVKYNHEAKGSKAGRRFEIVPQEIDGLTMPNDTFKPAGGDKYAVYHCMLPQEYIRNDYNLTGASWELFKAGVRHLFDHEEERYTFTGELDGIWAKQRWEAIKDNVRLGGYIRFTDEQFQQEGVLVRIVGIKDYLNNPYSPSIELSNEVVREGFMGEIKRLKSQTVAVEYKHKEAIQYAKRRFRDATETISMLEGALQAGLENFNEGISPIAVRTMSMLVGDESLQFRFVDSVHDPAPVTDGITYATDSKTLFAPENILQHMTLGIDTISPSNTTKAYHFWNVAEFNSGVLADGNEKYYLYLKADKDERTATAFYELHAEAKPKEDATHYYFLVGVLNSEYNQDRSFVRLYGFSEVLPGRITTDKIASADGSSYFDLAKNEFSLGGQLRFSPSEGLVVQNEGGAKDYIGLFRGEYVNGRLYYRGDEVTYSLNGVQSTYRYIHDTPTNNHTPQESAFWQVVAQGVKGADGRGVASITHEYYLSTSKTAPTGGTWSVTQPEWQQGKYLWTRTTYNYTDDTPPTINLTCNSEWEAIKAIEVGGRNLFGFQKGVVFGSENSNGLLSEITQRPDLGGFDIKITQSGTRGIVARLRNLGFARAGYYTATCEVMCSRAMPSASFNVNICNASAPSYRLTQAWQRITITANVTNHYQSNTYNGFVDFTLWTGHGLQAGDVISVRNLMVERGNMASDYKQAEEDVQWAIDNYNYLKKLFQQPTGMERGSVFGGMLQARDGDQVTAFLNGLRGKPAFAAGVENYGASNERYRTAFDFDGGGHVGDLHFRTQGGDSKLYIADDNGTERVRLSKSEIPELAHFLGLANGEAVLNSQAIDARVERRAVHEATKTSDTKSRDALVVGQSGGVLQLSGNCRYEAEGHSTHDDMRVQISLRDYDNPYYEEILSVTKITPPATGLREERTVRLDVTKYDIPQGRYYVNVGLYNGGYRLSAMVRVSGSVKYDQVDKRTYIASNGLASCHSKGQYVYIQNGILQAKGQTNLPGVLYAGRYDKTGQIKNAWGKRANPTPPWRIQQGSVRVYHNVGHTNYTVQLTPFAEWTDRSGATNIIALREITEWFFVVTILDANGNPRDGSFCFTIYGEN